MATTAQLRGGWAAGRAGGYGNVEDAIERAMDSCEQSRKQYLDLMKESGNRMLGMINTLLNVRKIETQNIEVNYSDINVLYLD